MRQGMLVVSVFLTGGLRAWLYFLLAGCVLEKKGSWEQRKILLGGAGAGAAAALFFLLQIPDYGRMCLEALLLGGCGAYLLGTEVRMSLFFGAFYEIAFSLWQLLLSAALAIWRGSEMFLDGRSPEGQAGSWLAFGLLEIGRAHV